MQSILIHSEVLQLQRQRPRVQRSMNVAAGDVKVGESARDEVEWQLLIGERLSIEFYLCHAIILIARNLFPLAKKSRKFPCLS